MTIETSPIHLEQIILRNFRCIQEVTLTFSDNFTLFLGDNGAGKTAIIEALRICIGAFLLGVKAVRVPNIHNTDLRESIFPDNLGSVQEPPELVVYEPTTILAEGRFDRKRIKWERSRREGHGERTSGNTQQIEAVAREMAQERSQRGSVTLPLLAYYPAQRIAPKRTDPIDRTLPPDRWERGYEGAFDAKLSQDVQLRWIRSMTLSGVQQGMSSPLLEAVLQGVSSCLDEYSSVYYSIQLEELVAVHESGKQRRARLLSEGYWTTLIFILDMAFRSALLNPHLGIDLLKRTPGIVLIDELDLHLHPKWQQRIVADMRRVFPLIQFIATTHSPLIGASLPSSCLYHLEIGEEGWCNARKFSENSLGLSPDQMLSSPYFDLENDRPVQVEVQLDKLAERISVGDSDAALEFLHRLNVGMETKVAV